ncbi:hypothetical protein XENOCAPTIV_000014, partial [Xenoophorus captivus]
MPLVQTLDILGDKEKGEEILEPEASIAKGDVGQKESEDKGPLALEWKEELLDKGKEYRDKGPLAMEWKEEPLDVGKEYRDKGPLALEWKEEPLDVGKEYRDKGPLTLEWKEEPLDVGKEMGKKGNVQVLQVQLLLEEKNRSQRKLDAAPAAAPG